MDVKTYQKLILITTLFCLAVSCKLGIADGDSFTGLPDLMPVISHSVPSYSSTGNASYGNNGVYHQVWQSWGTPPPHWLVYDLTDIDEDVKQNLLLSWMNDTHHFYSGNQYAVPQNYTVDVHTGDASGDVPVADDPGWVTLLDVHNQFKARQHFISMVNGSTVYNWLRIYIISVIRQEEGTDQVRLTMDIHDAGLGVENQIDWFAGFPGKFVTLNYGTNDSGGMGASNDEEFYDYFEQLVNAVLDLDKIPVVPSIPCPLGGSSRIEEENLVIEQLKNDYPEIIDGPDFWTFFEDRQYLRGNNR